MDVPRNEIDRGLTMGKKTNRLDKILINLKNLALVIMPLIILFYSNRITETIKDKEIGVKYVELSIKILSGDLETVLKEV